MKPGSLDDINDVAVCREVAFRAARRDFGATDEVLQAAEELLRNEADYEFVLSFLEDLQNLVSHGLDVLRSAGEVQAHLGTRSEVCWDTLTNFWTEVADWCARTGLPSEPVAPLLAIQNEQLKTLLWTGNRTHAGTEKIGLAHAVRYERSGGPAIPGYSHVTAALRATGQN
jgi:hypothetical protein